MTTTTPKKLTPAILEFCKSIEPSATPQWVRVIPDLQAEVNRCHEIVANKIAQDGGEPLVGWIIWEYPLLYLEAEYHSVWKSGDMLVDITPKADRERNILFLPSPGKIWDGKRPNNQLKALSNAPVVQRNFRLAEEMNRLMPQPGQVASVPMDKIRSLEMRQRSILNEMVFVQTLLMKRRP